MASTPRPHGFTEKAAAEITLVYSFRLSSNAGSSSVGVQVVNHLVASRGEVDIRSLSPDVPSFSFPGLSSSGSHGRRSLVSGGGGASHQYIEVEGGSPFTSC